ncbi:MAG: RNA polymerase factor sigma-54 [Armatimonadota bacterium]|nr:RNA polymerase factor sigma-54 [Armatimonadota bacterium]
MLIQDQSQTQQQRIDPKIIMANTLLQLSSLELQEAIEQELAENPALELEDEEPCSGCELAPFMCKDCSFQKLAAQNEETDISIYEIEPQFEFTFDPDDDNDPISSLQADVTLPEHLRNQLRALVTGKTYEIADYLVNYINDRGYLECDLLELTLELNATDDEIAEALAVLQTLDPPGVGARDLRECLLIQLRYLDEQGRGNTLAQRIVENCWEEMVGRKINRIARKLRTKPENVRAALRFIQTKLNPHPAGSFVAPWDYKPTDAKLSVRPDVIIRRTPTGYEIDVVFNEHLSLTINPYYRQIYNDLKSGKTKNISEDEKKHIFDYVERADLFIKNLNQRRRTLRNITKRIIEHQHGFLDTGSRLFLRPLTRVKIAEELGIHESTVSRATANKYVQIPTQEVVPFDFFFNSSHSVSDIIAQLIENEDPAHPLSDQEIARILNERGYNVARRTVVKYREAMKILSSRQRRR